MIDAGQLFLLAGVDLFFLRWQPAHLPSLTRDETVLILVLLNAIMIGYVWIARALPRWTAQRIARTWSPREQEMFFRMWRRP